jgi:phosphate transport system substrate-binding protein
MSGLRRLPGACAFAFTVLIVAACGNSSSSSSSASTPSASASSSASTPATSSASPSSGGSAQLNGAGSTFAGPMYQQWAGEYAKQNPGVQINYQPIGSGGGIAEFTQGVIDFGATDAPMSSSEQTTAQAAHGSVVLHIPMFLGSDAITYNLPGITSLRLDGPTVASIYLGKITSWNDPAIASLNPGVKLPGTKIQVVERSDSSGTSFVFTSYLTAISPTWASSVGANKAPTWPTGSGAPGNAGVAAAVQQSTGAIGYVEYGYAQQAKLPVASLKNAAGQFITPSTAATTAAAAGVTFPPNLKFSLINSASPTAYPIATATWIIIAQHQADPNKGKALVGWLKWALAPTQQGEVAALGYSPLPSGLDQQALAAVDSVTT